MIAGKSGKHLSILIINYNWLRHLSEKINIDIPGFGNTKWMKEKIAQISSLMWEERVGWLNHIVERKWLIRVEIGYSMTFFF